MKNWEVPTAILVFLILALVFRWGDLGSTTNNGTTTITKIDRWNRSVWQTTIKNGSYTEKIVSPSWFESRRKPIKQMEQYTEQIIPKWNSGESLSDWLAKDTTVTKVRIVEVPPPPIYLLSSDGLTKIFFCITSFISIWVLLSLFLSRKKETINEQHLF